MKLYATVQSERASKGQGGEYLDIVVKGENRKNILELHIEEINNEYVIDGYAISQRDDNKRSEYYIKYILEKGKSQKGEHKLIIKSLHDAMADCPCGWHFVSTGERSRAEIEEEFTKHL